MQISHEIAPRPDSLGGGWRLRLLEDGVEVGGGVFPPEVTSETSMEAALQAAFEDAESEAHAWLDSREA
ncbi:hypothetical protein F2K45_24445 [Salmonella enterica subsp. enterica]|nr:hypothetical protein [Salmonella enterica subsp. enterica serovar Heidelberg]